MSYTKEEIHQIVVNQREYFLTGETLSVKFRKEQLKKLREAIIKNAKKITDALHKDLGRHEFEGYFCDVGTIVLEINEYIH